MSLQEVDTILNKQSGLCGISKGKSDARDIEDGIHAGDELCVLAHANHLYLIFVLDQQEHKIQYLLYLYLMLL